MIKESEIQQAILEYLEARRIWHWRQKNTGFKHGDYWIKSGLRGVCDIIACHRGKTYAIEVKRPNGVLTQDQKEFLQNVQVFGGWIPVIARSVDDVMNIFENKV